MISGNLSLQHPSLHLRPEFRAAWGQSGEQVQVALMQPMGQDLGDTLQDVCQFNQSLPGKLAPALATYREEKAQEPAVVPSGPVLPRPSASQQRLREFRAALGSQFVEMTSRHSQQSLQAAQQIALTVNSWIGPALMTSCQPLEGGVVALQFQPQTSQEFIQDSPQPLAVLTGDRLISGPSAKALNSAALQPELPILFEPDRSKTVLLDASQGFLALKP
jgi:hypothetical protein